MQQLSIAQLLELLTDPAPPCMSLYQPTHRSRPETQQDPIRFGNLVRQAEGTMKSKYPPAVIRSIVDRLTALSHDSEFWAHRTGGLAVLASAAAFHVFTLQDTVRELLVVADSFHIKPLLRTLQSANRFQVLCLNRGDARLYEGTRDALDPVNLSHLLPASPEAPADEQEMSLAAVAGDALGTQNRRGQFIAHRGRGAKQDGVEHDEVRFFRALDRALLERHSRPSGLPLVLVSLPEHQATFRELSHNPLLADAGVPISPDALSDAQLREQTWALIEPRYQERLDRLIDSYRLAASRKVGGDNLAEVARAAVAGRVKMLLVEADREIPGRIDGETGAITSGSLAHAEFDDVLDDLLEVVLRAKGEGVVIPAAQMPSDTGAAAVYRY